MEQHLHHQGLLLLLLVSHSHFNAPGINVSFILFENKLAKTVMSFVCGKLTALFIFFFDPQNNPERPARL